jgi:HEAT repeat protein
MGPNCWIWICLVLGQLTVTSAQTVPKPDIGALMTRFNDDTLGPNAEEQILEAAKRDPAARPYVVQELPEMIRKPETDVWLRTVSLAGKLKAAEAVPALLLAMSRRPFPAETYLTFGGILRLDTDIVAKALARIGNPAIPGVENLMRSPDEMTRGRAIRILRNIDSPVARKALRERLPQEKNADLKEWIREGLQPSPAVKVANP